MSFDRLTLFGLVAVSLMLCTYALEDRSPWYILAFAAACVMGSVYGFLQGAWPFGFVEAAWSIVALNRWRQSRRTTGFQPVQRVFTGRAELANTQSASQGSETRGT
jgi:hypothetical protein